MRNKFSWMTIVVGDYDKGDDGKDENEEVFRFLTVACKARGKMGLILIMMASMRKKFLGS